MHDSDTETYILYIVAITIRMVGLIFEGLMSSRFTKTHVEFLILCVASRIVSFNFLGSLLT